MPIAFKCPECGARTEVADEFAGQSGPCASCGVYVTVPPLPGTGGAEGPTGGSWIKSAIFIAMALVLCGVIVMGALMSLFRPAADNALAEQITEQAGLIDRLDEFRMIPIDLQPWSNKQLDKDFHQTNGNNLAELPQGLLNFPIQRRRQPARDVLFQIGPGFIHLKGHQLPGFPKRVDGIPIDRACRALFIMHGVQWGQPTGVARGKKVGYYVVHYDDESKEMIPIEYGRDVRDWWDRSRSVDRGAVIWQGQNQATRNNSNSSHTVRLYLCAWTNPEPERKIASIDFVSTDSSDVAPFCVAVSAAVDAGPIRRLPREQRAAVATIDRLRGSMEAVASGQSTRVVSISLAKTDVTHDDLNQLESLTDVEMLDLSGTKLDHSALEHLSAFPQLRHLVLSDTTTGDDGLAALSALRQLRFLHLAGTPITDEGLAHLAGLTELRILTLNNTPVSDEGLESLRSLENLQTLNLYDTAVTDSGVEALSAALPQTTISH